MWTKYGESPLIKNTKELAHSLNNKYWYQNMISRFAMRYQNPSIESVKI